MLDYEKQLDLEIMFGEMLEKECANGDELDSLVETLTSLIECVADEVREVKEWD